VFLCIGSWLAFSSISPSSSDSAPKLISLRSSLLSLKETPLSYSHSRLSIPPGVLTLRTFPLMTKLPSPCIPRACPPTPYCDKRTLPFNTTCDLDFAKGINLFHSRPSTGFHRFFRVRRVVALEFAPCVLTFPPETICWPFSFLPFFFFRVYLTGFGQEIRLSLYCAEC